MRQGAEHVIDLESEVILAAHITAATASDSSTLTESLGKATENLERSGAECRTDEVVADKGYHTVETLAECVDIGYRTYIPQRKPSSKSGQRKWTDKTAEQQRAYRLNHDHIQRDKVSSTRRSEANELNGASLTCARPAAAGEPG